MSQRSGPLRTVLAHRAAFSRTTEDELRVWTVSQGTDAPLSVLDGDGRRLADVDLHGAGGAWGVAATPGGGCVVGSYYAGGMFAWDGIAPAAKVLGIPTAETTYVWDVVAVGQNLVLAVTYPDACVVSHTPEDGFRVLRRFGSDEILYGRALCVDLETRTVWVGLGVTPCRVIGFPLDDPESETVELAGLPDHLVPSQLSCHSGRIWIRAGAELWSFDPADPVAEQVAGTGDGISGYLSDPDQGRCWVTGADDQLCSIDLADRTATSALQLDCGPMLGSEIRDGVLTGMFGQSGPVLVRIDVSDAAAPASSSRFRLRSKPYHPIWAI